MKKKMNSLFSKDKVIKNKGVKYSELLEKFMTPFSNEFKHMEYIEDIFEYSINAWNFGNLKVIMPIEEFDKATVLNQNDDLNVRLLNKMINYKVAEFKDYTNFILDYDLTETSSDPILRVITQPEKEYLTTMLNNLDNEPTLYDFEENYIDRSAIVLTPQQPFIDWYSNLHPNVEFIEDIKDTNIYLIDETIDDIEKWLKKKFDKLFVLELDEWHSNKKEWPQNRNYKMFKQWFQIKVSNMIYDLERKPISKAE